MIDRATEYARAVVGGEVAACRMIRLACERHLADLEAGVWYWDCEDAELALDFFRLLKHHKGAHGGKVFELEPWQCFIVGNLFGWKERRGGFRRFREGYIEIPRKNGKSTLAAGIVLLMFVLDGEPGAEVYTVATKEEQAKIVWDAARIMVNQAHRSLRRRVKVLHKTMRVDATHSVCKPLGRDSKTQDGLNPSCAICDEVHAWPSREMYDVIDSGFGGRDQPLLVMITTAGFSRECFCFETRRHAVNVLEGRDEGYVDDALFAYVATPDEGDDPFDEATWVKVNPSLGGAKKWDYMRKAAEKAKLLPAAKNNFLVKQLCQWVEAAGVWIPLDRWDRGKRAIDWRSFEGRVCYTGLDLASSTDFVAAVHVFPPEDVGGPYAVLPRLWIPEETLGDNARLRDRRVLDQMRAWRTAGLIETTPGDWIDYEIILHRLVEDAKRFRIAEVGFDPHNAGDLPVKLETENINCVAIGQGHRMLGAPTKELERLVLAGLWHHDGHRVMRWMMGNVVLIPDTYGNQRPDKRKSHEKIDGVVAMIMGLQRAMSVEKVVIPGVAFL